jgi:xylulokinase
MSLVGIDVGSSSVKVVAYSADGKTLTSYRRDLSPSHPVPGSWEQDPEQVWKTVCDGMRALAHNRALKKDPLAALAVSASGRENFPADARGIPLGPCIMAGDLRGEELELPPPGAPWPEPWTLSCGHLRQRMDPALRSVWWKKNRPDVMARAASFPGWHEFLAQRIAGRYVADRSVASRWLPYDIASRGWVKERAAAYSIDAGLLPEIMPWGAAIGTVKQDVAKDWGIPASVILGVGALDLSCLAVGAGALHAGTALLSSGSFENQLVPTDRLPTASMLLKGLSVSPYPGVAELSVLALNPTGTFVLNWVRNLLGISIEELDRELAGAGSGPSPVIAVPYLSGSMLYWEGGRKARGGLVGLTLATSRMDVTRAFMESIAYDHVTTVQMLKQEGITVNKLKGSGGGTRSKWWTQLKADLMGVPIEVVGNAEPGTIGAAMLAGLAAGTWHSMEEAGKCFEVPGTLYQPDLKRGELHRERLESYHQTVSTLLQNVYARDLVH